MGHGGNVIIELMTDHREVEELFARVQALPAGDERRGEIAERFTIELVRHSVAEEQHLYPAVREHVPGGDALADKEIADHEIVERLLKQLEGVDCGDARFDVLVDRVVSEVTAHVQDEERNLFPALAEACPPERLDELGEQVRRAKKLAPTRPHPNAPDNKLIAAGAGLVDRARDFVTGRGGSD
ncbi:hemerythrin HHE cation binding domain-containing protein [Streptomyces sp. 1114.5]|uniref:hemerythrin domain-containing protein n=1 Tax=unclassified Streptomyces TaxID=2593676 RepID=UPI000BCAE0B5|nr:MULTISPECIES: hemerythrin domain-containing protein [unclassified Streptomyces]RKT19487.1 hemerythrin HHE cation binding domain-containing protein [Streptomyces sp. 1114.5]SOB85683.1 Hemerythrin HHE cation binding domain-containing protein [Streptomyces sp. 1331.2]